MVLAGGLTAHLTENAQKLAPEVESISPYNFVSLNAFQLTLNPNLFAKKTSNDKLPQPESSGSDGGAPSIKEEPDQEQNIRDEGASPAEGSGVAGGGAANYPQDAVDAEQSLMKMQLRKWLILSSSFRVSHHIPPIRCPSLPGQPARLPAGSHVCRTAELQPGSAGEQQALLPRLPQELQLQLCPPDPHAHPHGRQALPVQCLPEGLHHQGESEGACQSGTIFSCGFF